MLHQSYIEYQSYKYIHSGRKENNFTLRGRSKHSGSFNSIVDSNSRSALNLAPTIHNCKTKLLAARAKIMGTQSLGEGTINSRPVVGLV